MRGAVQHKEHNRQNGRSYVKTQNFCFTTKTMFGCVLTYPSYGRHSTRVRFARIVSIAVARQNSVYTLFCIINYLDKYDAMPNSVRNLIN